MGITQVTVTVCNPGNPERRWEGLSLVDTSSVDGFREICSLLQKKINISINLTTLI